MDNFLRRRTALPSFCCVLGAFSDVSGDDRLKAPTPTVRFGRFRHGFAHGIGEKGNLLPALTVGCWLALE
jgi:hypothetical protein